MAVKCDFQMASTYICGYCAGAPPFLSYLGTNPVVLYGFYRAIYNWSWCQQQNGIYLINGWVKRTLVFGLQYIDFYKFNVLEPK